MNNLLVISLGGSLIVPSSGMDTAFLKKFKNLIEKHTFFGQRFILITGGGEICRQYQRGLNIVKKVSNEELDWMGIYATRLNAQLVRLMFGRLAHLKVVDDPNKKTEFKEKILVAAGWKPGRSTDDDAVRLAKVYDSRTIINLSNIDYLYTKDPKKHKDARPIKQISWKDYCQMAGSSWNPGAHVPFDPVAARFAEKQKQKVIIANGKDLKNLSNIFRNKKFEGTTIQ